MNIEKNIEDLCLELAELESWVKCVAMVNVAGLSVKEVAGIKAEQEIAIAKMEAINIQLEELRKDYAKEYNARAQCISAFTSIEQNDQTKH